MKLSLRDRIKVLLTGSLFDYQKAFITGADLPGSAVISSETAMKYAAVNACVRVRAETFASVPALMYRKTDEGRETVNDVYLADIWHSRPNSEMAPFSFKETLMTNFDVSGNSVCERLVNSRGELVGLYPYRHELVTIDRNKENRQLEYKIGNGPDAKTLKRDQVFHVPNLSFDGVVGMSPIKYAASSISLGLSYENYGVTFYANAAMPSGVFESPSALSPGAFERLKKDLAENYTGLRKAGVPMLLEEGMKWHQLTINPVDAQLIESKYFQIEDICRIYRVPQHLIGLLQHATFTNIEHQSLEFVMYTMLPIFKRFEDAINSQLLTSAQRKAGMYIEFKIDGLLRGDQKSRAEAYAVGRQWGWLSVNDIRRLENMPPIPNGDRYLEPLNFVEAGQTNKGSETRNYTKLVDDIARMLEERR